MRPQNQNYNSVKKHQSVTVDVGFLSLRHGEFIHIDAGGKAIEVRMDDDGNVGICVSDGVDVATLNEVYQ